MNKAEEKNVFIKELKSKEDYLKLIEEVLEHDKRYYQECAPIITDFEYDRMVKQLEKFEKEHPSQISPNSPTQRVGESVSKGFVQHKHIHPMLSLSNTYSEKEIEDFIKRVHKLLDKEEVEFCLELKMDGTAVSLRYEDGKLTRALTRGNGQIGDDITNNIKTLRNVPRELHGSYPRLLEVRGEVFMPLNTFRELNEQREEEGLELFANPRNSAAGSLKLLDSREVSKRKLDIVCYGVAEGQEEVATQYDLHKYLRRMGIPVSDENHFSKASDMKDIVSFIERTRKERKNLPFEIDGIVIKVNDLKLQNQIGATGKSPRFATAYKFAPEQALTQINEITVQVGRTGVLTPVAELETVPLAGSCISRATLHNADEIKRKDIREKDWVIIEKGGDVIPKVVEVDLSKRKIDSKPWHMPTHCPACKTDVIHVEGEVAIRCPNPKCHGRRLRNLVYFVGKQAMDIDHLGPKVIEHLVDKGFITRPSDIYALTETELKEIEGFKEKSISNLLNSIEKSKHCPLAKFLMALEIKYVGKETAELLAEHEGTLDNLMAASEEELEAIEGIGEKVASSIHSYFKDHSNIEEINKLLSHGVKIESPEKKKKIEGHSFNGKAFVLTGTLKNHTRDEATALIKERGGKTVGVVSSKTDYVLVGEDPGSKYDKAQVLHINIIDEKTFESML